MSFGIESGNIRDFSGKKKKKISKFAVPSRSTMKKERKKWNDQDVDINGKEAVLPTG